MLVGIVLAAPWLAPYDPGRQFPYPYAPPMPPHVIDDQGAELVIHIVGEGGAQRGEFDVAGPHHAGRVLVIDQAE